MKDATPCYLVFSRSQSHGAHFPHSARSGGNISFSLRVAPHAQRLNAARAFFSRSRTKSANLARCVARCAAFCHPFFFFFFHQPSATPPHWLWLVQMEVPCRAPRDVSGPPKPPAWRTGGTTRLLLTPEASRTPGWFDPRARQRRRRRRSRCRLSWVRWTV